MTEMIKSTKRRKPPTPKILINADDLAHIEALAEGAAFYWDTRDNQRRMLSVI